MAENFRLKNLIHPDVLREMQESFAHSTGMGAVFTDELGHHIDEGSNFTAYCRRIRATKGGIDGCHMSNYYATLTAIKSRKPYIYLCHAGLVDIEIPIILDGQVVGSVMAGQIRCHPEEFPDMKQMPSPRDWCQDPELKELYERTEVMPRRRIEAAAKSLFFVSNYIIEKSVSEILQRRLNEQQAELIKALQKQSGMEKALKMAELEALQKQINPHFMFNILNSISRLVSLEEMDKAQRVIDTFSKMLRYSFKGAKNIATLEKELNYVEKYLYLQKIRFGDHIDYVIDVDDDMLSLEMPFFSLQPFVENSIVHGLELKDASGQIIISGRNSPKKYVIVIEDNGVGIPVSTLQKISRYLFSPKGNMGLEPYGMKNTHDRLKLFFGDRFAMKIKSAVGKGTKITLSISKEGPRGG
jgi:ligand-binding sensor protein